MLYYIFCVLNVQTKKYEEEETTISIALLLKRFELHVYFDNREKVEKLIEMKNFYRLMRCHGDNKCFVRINSKMLKSLDDFFFLILFTFIYFFFFYVVVAVFHHIQSCTAQASAISQTNIMSREMNCTLTLFGAIYEWKEYGQQRIIYFSQLQERKIVCFVFILFFFSHPK